MLHGFFMIVGTCSARWVRIDALPAERSAHALPTMAFVDWWQLLIVIAGGMLLVWLALLMTLWITQRGKSDPTSVRDALRLLPDVVRLLRRLGADPDLPRGVRVRLWLLLGYLLLPIDLVPDFIPVLGYADDAIIVALAVRAVVRRAGPEALARHWPGTHEGLRTVHRLAQLPPPAAPGCGQLNR